MRARLKTLRAGAVSGAGDALEDDAMVRTRVDSVLVRKGVRRWRRMNTEARPMGRKQAKPCSMLTKEIRYIPAFGSSL